ncbi:MAG TPA: thiamine phosphate synthase [Longimicrobiaceae bacterium]|nr:thiamine phosphate synthase [Longimicrobiaceae bacterium]
MIEGSRALELMVVTDPECGAGREIADVVRAALQGGAPSIQLRAKSVSTRETVELGRRLLTETRTAGALLFVNDRIDVALALGADGVHLGDDDLPLPDAVRLAPPGFLIGRSVETPDQARAATRHGAAYLGVGTVFPTPSKLDTGEAIGLAGVASVRAATALPLVAIGGIDAENAAAVVKAGADGIAVIRAVLQAPEPDRAARELIHAVRRGVVGRDR